MTGPVSTSPVFVDMLEFTVIGLPAPQGSKKLVGRGRPVIVDDNRPGLRSWRGAVATAGYDALAGRYGWPAAHPVTLTVTFWLPRPATAPRRVLYPAKKPDLDKLLRALMDSLTDAGVVHDDAQIVDVHARKRFVPPGSPLGASVRLVSTPPPLDDLAAAIWRHPAGKGKP